MLNKIIHFSLQNRILVLVVSVLLLIGGTYTAMHTEVDVFPDLNAPTVVIMTEANGMAAEEVEQLVTFPVETAVNGATGVRRVRSSSTNGFSVVWVEFDWETDVYLARQIVSEKLAVVSESLPSNVGKPTLGPQSSILGEMLIVGLTADSTSMLDLRTIADWTIRPRLLSTGGVAQVAEKKITCLMVTHNMHQALELGNRTLMMDAGRIVFDVKGAERSKMTVDDLLEKFRENAGKNLDNDRILLSKVEK